MNPIPQEKQQALVDRLMQASGGSVFARSATALFHHGTPVGSRVRGPGTVPCAHSFTDHV